MNRFLKVTSLIIAIAIFIIVANYVIVVIRAREMTPKIISGALKAEDNPLKIGDLSDWQIRALLKIEDPAFYQHKGVDLRTPGAGLTTITQSLVKIYYFDHFKPGFAKIKQTLIARFALDPLVSKNDQLQLFINHIYLGTVNNRPVVGFVNAARVYYQKEVNQLTERDYLSIVAMINSSRAFSISDRPGANRERTERLILVVEGKYIPTHLMDMYYGKLDSATQKLLAPSSYFPGIYEKK
ncbi:MAG TPA: transglycosylase domain-containing protein [Bacillota bacterium]